MAKYARGKRAWGICGRSGRKMLLNDMVFDGRYPNMRVDPAWFEPKDPLDYAPRVDDPVALWRPAPDNWRLTAPVLTLESQSNTEAVLSWTASISDAYQTTQYQLFYRPLDSEINWIAGPVFEITRDIFGEITEQPLSTVYTLPTPGGIYEFLLVASDSGGLSANSNEVQMEDIPPELSFVFIAGLYLFFYLGYRDPDTGSVVSNNTGYTFASLLVHEAYGDLVVVSADLYAAVLANPSAFTFSLVGPGVNNNFTGAAANLSTPGQIGWSSIDLPQAGETYTLTIQETP